MSDRDSSEDRCIRSENYSAHLEDSDKEELQEDEVINESLPIRSASVSISASINSDGQFLISKQQNTTCFVIILTFVSAIGGFLFGYDTGVVSGAVILLKAEFQLTSVWQEAFISVTLGAAAISSILSGCANDKFGRKPTIMVSSVLFTTGAILLGAATTLWELILGRVILGVSIGFASSTFPMYIAENAPSHLRGRLVTINNLCVTGGQFIAGIVAGLFSPHHDGWRYMLGLSAIPALLQVICFIVMPESPRWLVQKGRIDEACAVLRRIRGDVDIDQEMNEIEMSCQESSVYSGSTFLRMLSTPHVRWALFIGAMCQIFQQVVGINTVMYYSATIIKMAGVRSTVTAIWLSALVSFGNFVFGFIGLCLIDRIGRRILILSSIVGTMCSLIVLGVGFQLASTHSPNITSVEMGAFLNITNNSNQCSNYTSCNGCTTDLTCGFCEWTDSQGEVLNNSCMAVGVNAVTGEPVTGHSKYGRCSNYTDSSADLIWTYEYCPNQFAWMAILGLLLYVAFFAPGLGSVPWTVNSEIYPNWARSTGNSIATSLNWMVNALISMTFLSLTEAITKEGAFWLYAGMAALCFVFMWLFLPETKGKHLEDVEQLFRGSRFVPYAAKRRASDYERLDNILNDDH